MGRIRSTVLLVTIIIAMTVPAISWDSYAADPPNVDPEPEPFEADIYGYVTNLSDQEKNTPLRGVSVHLYGKDRFEPIDTTLTDSNGMFGFTLTYTPEDYCYLLFEYSGYTIRAIPDRDMIVDDNGFVRFQLSSDMVDKDGKYAISGPADGPHAFVMAITTGTIYGTVYGSLDDDRFVLGGAEVTLVSETGQNYSTTTDSNGYFQIECPYGTYTMSVSCNGFASSDDLTVTTDNDSSYTVSLTQNRSDVLFGLDSAHAPMLVGIIILLLIILITALMLRRSKEPESSIVIENDLSPAEDEDVKHP